MTRHSEAEEIYKRAVAQARETFDKAEAPVWEDYMDAESLAWEAYEKDIAPLLKARTQSLAEANEVYLKVKGIA